MSEWLTAKQAAAHAQCGVQAIYLGVKRGKLRAAKINGAREYRFLREWIDEWLLKTTTPEEIQPRV